MGKSTQLKLNHCLILDVSQTSVAGPTSFDSSMFSQVTEEVVTTSSGSTILPPPSSIMKPEDNYPPPVGMDVINIAPQPGGSAEVSQEGSTHKSHKVKKKKKKSKKHKHKHKHEKGDKDKDKSGWLERKLHTGGLVDPPLSSDASNANSPYVNTPSSPEFEEI